MMEQINNFNPDKPITEYTEKELREYFKNYNARGTLKRLKKEYISNSKLKYICASDFYLQYPYKTRTVTGNTVPIPYFPKEQISDHKHALTYKEYKRILEVYFEILIEKLFTGTILLLPFFLGKMYLLRTKYKKVNYKKTKEIYGSQKGLEEQKFIYHKDLMLNNERLLLKWERKNSRFPNSLYWKFQITRGLYNDKLQTVKNKEVPITNFLARR